MVERDPDPGATSIEEMIEYLQAAVDNLRAMQAAGVTMADDVEVDGTATLVTTDPAVAEEFGFKEDECWEEDDYDFGDDECELEEDEQDGGCGGSI